MTTAEKIELIVTTVAGYYGVEWQELWRMRFQKKAPMRRNMVKLLCEHLELNRFQICDHLSFSPQTIREYMEDPKDSDYSRIDHEIRMQFVCKKAS